MRLQQITKEETQMMQQAYIFLTRHCNPPANQEEDAVDWWTETAKEAGELDAAWSGNPLIREILLALINYIEHKAKVLTEEKNHVSEL